jgi:hypothetical protein
MFGDASWGLNCNCHILLWWFLLRCCHSGLGSARTRPWLSVLLFDDLDPPDMFLAFEPGVKSIDSTPLPLIPISFYCGFFGFEYSCATHLAPSDKSDFFRDFSVSILGPLFSMRGFDGAITMLLLICYNHQTELEYNRHLGRKYVDDWNI